MTLRKMEVDGGLFEIAMPKQDLNGAQIRTRLEKMRGEAVAQGVGMDLFLDACALGRFLARVPRCFRIDGPITVVPTVAWKQPFAGFSRQTTPVFAQLLEQFCAEHHISVSASLAALNVN